GGGICIANPGSSATRPGKEIPPLPLPLSRQGRREKDNPPTLSIDVTDSPSLRRAVRRRHSPDHVGKISRNDERAARIHAHADRPAACITILIEKPGHEIDGRRARGPAIAEWHEHYLESHRHLAVPAAVLADEY